MTKGRMWVTVSSLFFWWLNIFIIGECLCIKEMLRWVIKIKKLSFSTKTNHSCRDQSLTKAPRWSPSKTENSSWRAKPKYIPSMSKPTPKANLSKTGSSITLSKFLTETLHCWLCSPTSTSFAKKVSIISFRRRKIRGSEDHWCSIRKWSQDNPILEIAGRCEYGLRQRYFASIP